MAKVPESGLPSVEVLEGLSSPIEPVGRKVNLPYAESDILKGLDAHGAHADELFLIFNDETGKFY